VESKRNHNTRKTDNQKAGVDLGFTSKFGSPDWTMLITNSPCLKNRIDWLLKQDDVRTFFENTKEDIYIPAYRPPVLLEAKPAQL